ncbi:LOW QUALITY PROTEIN: protein terminus-like [Drosophila nasuta]|uniref:LOW QUALITY PROTEIN: protein terminus-like n=1 Tax=Drosophila nasuta TaxID=42062 RepID=UPI00295ECAB2|nr:LOW QUALITY PROTEIN: protein terminus-like [Drosophila nasuta]
MSHQRQSRFIFETRRNVRTFRHQPYMNDSSLECESCRSPVAANEPFSHHWLSGEDAQHIKLDLERKLLLKQIEKECIETFMLCDESAYGRTQEFMLDAGTQAVPQLLRFLNYEANELVVTIGFYVTVLKERLYFESYSFNIKHFLDIEATVDMVFTRLVEKISSYMFLVMGLFLDSCTIKRIKITVKRLYNGQELLPLQYRIKNKGGFKANNNRKSVNLSLLNESYINYHGIRFGKFPDSLQVNLYCFRVCASTRELFAVPYLIRSEDVKNTPTFLIQTDVAGEFRGMYEVPNIRRFLRTEPNDRIIVCRVCQAHFTNRMHYVLHKQIDCGNDVTVLQMDGESFEIYENCITLPKEFFKFAWFGIGPNY